MSMPGAMLIAALREAVCESFETLAFAEVSAWEPLDSEPDELRFCIGARIQLKRPVSGVLTLFVDRTQCAEFAGAISGVDLSETLEKVEFLHDFLSELVNTIAGRFAASVAGDSKTTGLGLPSIVGQWNAERESFDQGLLIGFDVDESRAFLHVG